jgi:hypothetical protein
MTACPPEPWLVATAIWGAFTGVIGVAVGYWIART